MRPYQLATAAILIVIAAVAMFDTRGGALPDASGGAPGGLKGGWYPFWSAALATVALLVVVYRTLVTPQSAQGVVTGRQGVLDVLGLILPMIVLVLLMDRLLGFYAAGGLYLGYFARVIGRYRWIWAIASAILIPLALYVIFEYGFRVFLPKSIWYAQGLPF
ncbi:MAG: tripartite tricarboxylate transporter TctB family protein [Thermoleophilaceae bacterium]